MGIPSPEIEAVPVVTYMVSKTDEVPCLADLQTDELRRMLARSRVVIGANRSYTRTVVLKNNYGPHHAVTVERLLDPSAA